VSEVNFTNGLYRRIWQAAIRGQRVNAVSMAAECLFWRLHLASDDYGTFLAELAEVRVFALPKRPMSDADLQALLDELYYHRLIGYFSAGGDRYGSILDYLKFQPAGRNGKRVRRHPAPPPSGPEVYYGDGESATTAQTPPAPPLPPVNHFQQDMQESFEPWSVLANALQVAGVLDVTRIGPGQRTSLETIIAVWGDKSRDKCLELMKLATGRDKLRYVEQAALNEQQRRAAAASTGANHHGRHEELEL
jgi:hypothetical protein